MDITVFTELEFFFRILIAGICGGLIGYERNNRLKEAGIRTHLIVALAAGPICLRFGVDSIASTKPSFGSRGWIIPAAMQQISIIGWNDLDDDERAQRTIDRFLAELETAGQAR